MTLGTYKQDIFDCYKTNHLVLDSQNSWKMEDVEDAKNFLTGYTEAVDSCVIGVFDNQLRYLYGFIIFIFNSPLFQVLFICYLFS